MNNKILATLALGITAALGLTSCSSAGTPEATAEGNPEKSGFTSTACNIIDAVTIFSLSSCSTRKALPAESASITPEAEEQAKPEKADSVSEPLQKTEEAENAADTDGKIGQELVNGGVTLKVLNTEVVDSIQMNRSGYVDAKDTDYSIEKPGKGGKFVRVDTLIKNTGDASMDLTCGWAVENRLLDSSERSFDPIDELYMLRGNPECNANLQPGFESEMSYIYMIPENASTEIFSFRDTSEESESVFTHVSLR